MIRALVLGLSLTFVASQAVSWADCCCGSFCQRKNACTGCGPEDGCPGAAGASSCCDEDPSEPPKTCSHQEPSSEIDAAFAQAPDLGPSEVAPAALLELQVPTAPRWRPAVDVRPPRAGPLLVCMSVLQI